MKADFLPGNAIELLETGAEFFPALVKAIDCAALEVHLQTYIFEPDETGQAVVAALRRAARRGVSVYVLVDGFGGRSYAEHLRPKLVADGVRVLMYREEIEWLSFRRRRLRRLHRKVAIMDRRVAFVGGINVLNDVDAPDQTHPRYDYAVRVQGPLLESIYASTHRIWELVAWASLRRRIHRTAAHPLHTTHCGDLRAAFVIRDNIRHRRDIEDAYLEAIESARSEIVLANAYFLPGRRFRQALTQAAARGVRVHILLQGRVEYLLLHYATQALYGSLLKMGIRIYEYHLSFLHAKVAVVDGHWATVGSSNIDPFSLLLAREANVVVRDNGFASALRGSLARAMEHGAKELKAEDWKRKSRVRRAANWLAYTAVRLMIGLAGYGGKH
mgnify:FL=1